MGNVLFLRCLRPLHFARSYRVRAGDAPFRVMGAHTKTGPQKTRDKATYSSFRSNLLEE